MKEKLINKLFDEFDKNKETIKNNLLKVMNEIVLTTSDEYNKVTLIAKIERK